MRGDEYHHGGRGEFGRGGDGRRMRRGHVPDLLLAALLAGPAHGYELMDRLEKLSGGTWRPSPGSVYPLLQAFEDKGLVKGHESEGRRVFTLTDAGREAAEQRQVVEVAARFPSDSQPSELHAEMIQLRAASKHLAMNATPEQMEQAVALVRETRQAIYRLLAGE